MTPFCNDCGEDWPCEVTRVVIEYHNLSFLLERTGEDIANALRILMNLDPNETIRARAILNASFDAIARKNRVSRVPRPQ